MPITRINRKHSVGKLTAQSTDAEIRADKTIRRNYGALLDRYPTHPVHMKDHGDGILVLRWKRNIIIDRMFNMNMMDLNRLWAVVDQENAVEMEDMATVYRMMGYSLCGFIEVFGDRIKGI